MPIGLMLGGTFMCSKNSEKYVIPTRKFSGNKEHCESSTVCGHARHVMYLSPEGRILPCMALSSMDLQQNYPLATEIGLAKGLSDSTYMELIDTRVSKYFEHNPDCIECEHKYFCGGGCRASSLAGGGTDIMAKDPAACIIFKGGYGDKIDSLAKAAIAARS